mmetsp:Transcript_70144/g.195139  ORF Transcript_70144/g.195139 Transcript_70144/m.195139 type:complete len:540 (+) Transcript_70144:48-1667(+)
MWRLLLATKSREELLLTGDGSHCLGGEGGELTRSLRTVDLLAIGIGGTVGTGVFSITGQVAGEQAGPAVVLCWLIGGVGCLLSALSYMELSARLPLTGSVYTFAYNALGEVFAVIAAACITLEYGISASAVAVNWGTKFKTLVQSFGAPGLASNLFLELGSVTLSAPAVILLLIVTALIALGGALCKAFTRGSSALAVVLIIIMSAIALWDFDASHFDPFVPPEFGANGVFAGSVTTFFGFLGYDEVCCLAGEAQDPRKSVPVAVLGTIVVATVLPVIGSLALVGMAPYAEIDANAGFEVAFRQKGWHTLAHAVAIGQLVVLFVVTYMCFMAQPRVFYALAKDGLLPKRFLEVDAQGNLRFASLATGVLLIACGAVLPFDTLANAISGGVLVVFTLANCCVIMLRSKSAHSGAFVGNRSGRSAGVLLSSFVLLCTVAAFLVQHSQGGVGYIIAGLILTATALVILVVLSRHVDNDLVGEDVFFRVPCVPWVPALAIAFNSIMLASLTLADFALMVIYLALVLVPYLVLSFLRHRRGTRQ